MQHVRVGRRICRRDCKRLYSHEPVDHADPDVERMRSGIVRPHSPSASRRAPTPSRKRETASIAMLRTLSTGMHRFGTLLIALFAALAIPAAAQAGALKVQAGVVSYTDTSTSDANIVTFGISPDGTRISVTDSGVGTRNRPITVT